MSDDGSKVYLDGKLVTNNWGIHPPRNKDAGIKLDAGYHDIFVEMYENNGRAALAASYMGPDTGNKM